MAQFIIDISDELLNILQKKAAGEKKEVREVIFEELEEILKKEEKQPDLETLLLQSGVFARPENKLDPYLRALARPISKKRRAYLAKKAAIGKPLSQVIIKERHSGTING